MKNESLNAKSKKASLKIASFFMAILMVLCLFPVTAVAATTTPGKVTESTALSRINELVDKFSNCYFTVDNKTGKDRSYTYANLSDVSQASWFVTKVGRGSLSYGNMAATRVYDGSKTTSWGVGGSQCYGFANFAHWYIFTSKNTDNIESTAVFSGKTNYNNVKNNAKPGDILCTYKNSEDMHSMIYISCDSSGVTVLDANWANGTGSSIIQKHKIVWSDLSYYTYLCITRATNYDTTSFDIKVTGVSVSPTSASLTVGNTKTLTATVSPSNATNKSVTWSSTNTNVATVSSSGVVTAKAKGTATIKATTSDGGYVASCSVTVTTAATDDEGWFRPVDELFFGHTGCNTHDASDYFEGLGYVAITNSITESHKALDIGSWASHSQKIYGTNVYATRSGQVLAAGKGTGDSSDLGYYVYIKHNVNGVAYISRYLHMKEMPLVSKGDNVEQGKVIGKVGDSGAEGQPHLHFDICKCNEKYENITSWNSFSKSLRIDPTPGKVITYKVKLSAVKVTSISVSPTSASLTVGETKTLTATVSPSNATNKAVTWSSTNTNVATVSSSGVVTAKAKGTATIKATTSDGGYVASCSVTVNPITYIVTYDANGGSGAPASQTKEKGIGLTLSSSVPTRSGYTFKGWQAPSTTAKSEWSTTKPTSGSYETGYKFYTWGCECKNSKSFGANYDEDDYTFTTCMTQEKAIKHIKDNPDYFGTYSPSLVRYFWKIESTKKGGPDSDGDWAYTVGESSHVNVDFICLDGTVGTHSIWKTTFWFESEVYRQDVTVPGKIYQPGEIYSGDANVTLTAVWEENAAPQTYTITYNANGGSGAPASQTKTKGNGLALSTVEPTRQNYVFLYWQDDSENIYYPGDMYYQDENLDLTAVWGPDWRPEIYIGSATGTPGSVVTVPVTITNNLDRDQIYFIFCLNDDEIDLEFIDFKTASVVPVNGLIGEIYYQIPEDAAVGTEYILDMYIDKFITGPKEEEYDLTDFIEVHTGSVTVMEPEEDDEEEIDENAPHIVISNAKGKPGNTVEIPFVFNNNPGFAGGEMEIVYDKNDLKLTEITLGTLPSNTEYNVSTGKIAFGSSSNITGSGALFTAKFEILASEDKRCGIELDIAELYNAADEDITVPIVDGEVEIYNYIIGDANDDGKISSRDATRILQYIVGNAGASDINLAAADFNGDGSVTSRDATAILKYIVSQ